MENNKEKVKYIGEIALIVCLEIIILLFRMVQPIVWPAQVPLVWQNFGNEVIFSGIEFGLIIVIVVHFIFNISFKDLGLVGFKDNFRSLIGNLCFVGICVGVSFLVGQFSKLVAFDGLNIALQIVLNFTMIAVIREIVFRGFLFQSIFKLFNGKGIITSIITGTLFAMTYIPNILINLNEVHTSTIFSALAVPVVLGIYLGLIYYYGRNLWLGIMIQGVYLSIGVLESDLFINLLAGIYTLGLFIYLIYKMIKYYKYGDKYGDLDHDKGEVDKEIQVSSETINLESETTKKIEAQVNIDNVREIKIPPKVSVTKVIDENEHLASDYTKDISKVHPVQTIETWKKDNQKELVGKKEKQALEEDNQFHDETVIDVPQFKNVEQVLDENLGHDLQEKLDQTVVLPNLVHEIEEVIKIKKQGIEEEEDLGKVAIIPNTKEELGKVVNLQARKEKMKQEANESEILDNTIVMPCISETDTKEDVARFDSKDIEVMMQAEPNFIAHLEKYLGDFEGVYKQAVPSDMLIDILCFSGETYNALVTNGMRAMTMAVPPELQGYEQTELMMFVDKSFDLSTRTVQKEQSAWLINLLTDLALYPNQTNSYLGWGHIVGNGVNLDTYAPSIAYCGALIYPPMVEDDMAFYRYIEKDKSIFIYNVMPLFKEELRFIQEHSSEQFINLMSEMGVNQVVKPKRLNVIKAMNKSL